MLVDTGPLVAMQLRDEQHYLACVRVAETLPAPLFTTWPVLTEAFWLLRRSSVAQDSLLMLVSNRLLVPLHLDHDAAAWLHEFLFRYRGLKPQVADASLCYVAGKEKIDTVFTLDRRDFVVFRQASGEPFRLLPDSF